MKLGIGIDTGGTYTDAVVYNFEDKTILGSAKSLTTRNDLTIGILGAIDGLPQDLTRQAEIISLSTTLATNACVEDRGGKAKLIFFGGSQKTIDDLGGKYGLPPSEDIYIQESFTQFSGKMDKEPDWDLFNAQIENGFENLDGAGIIEMNSTRNGGFVEKKAKKFFQEKHNIPVVCGHELFNVLNSLQRGSSTLLNASLFPVISEFLAAVKKALTIRDIKAPIVIVRSDGSLMSEDFASLRPVETLLCGPAASAVGGTQLTESQNCIIVDMGGTTTDLAFVKNGIPISVVDGVSIGKWKTFVDGLYVKTFGLGGDSAIHYTKSSMFLEEYRVIPLCIAAQEHPSIIDNLKSLDVKQHNHFLYEHYILIKDINDKYSSEEIAFCKALKNRPLMLTEAAEAIGKDTYTLDVKRLIKDGIVQICGLTPTDIMHIKGDFNKYCSEASLLAAKFAAYNLDISVMEFCDLAYNEVKKKMYQNIVKALYEIKYPDYMKNGVNKDVERFINDNYEEIISGNCDDLMSNTIRTNYSLVGIGAPIKVFLDDVAKMLGTKSVIPKYHEVANALGAIVGSINASFSVEIKPNNNAEGTTGYTVFGKDISKVFEKMEDALSYAKAEAEEGAKTEAINRGATGKLTVTLDMHRDEAESRDGTVYLGTIVTARAVGAVGF